MTAHGISLVDETWFRPRYRHTIPFIVVLTRLYRGAWAYYVAGGALSVSAMVLFELDTAARDRSNAAGQAADAARRDYEAALAAWRAQSDEPAPG